MACALRAYGLGPGGGGGGGRARGDRQAREAQAGLQSLADWYRGEDDGIESAAFTSRAVTERELLTGTSFALTGATSEGGFGALWGRGTTARFDAREGDLTLDGEVASAMVGADITRGRGTAGLVVGHSLGGGAYRSPSGDGEVESTLTGLYPWGRYEASERLSLWGVAGYGAGMLTLMPEGTAPIETDMDLVMGALGGRRVLVKPPAEGGLELSVESDALVVRTSSDEVRGRAGSLAASQADVTRLRLGLEGTWRAIETGGDGTFLPTLEIGMRHDGGDADTGFGVDIGAGLAWSDPVRGVEAQASARGLLTHAAGGFREHGLAGAGLVGPGAAGGAWVPGAVNDDDKPGRRSLEAKLGYGFALFGGRYTGVPEVGFGLTETGREMILGGRLLDARRSGLVFGLDIEGRRRESTEDDRDLVHRIGLGLGWELTGARREDLELRFETARRLPAHGDPDNRITVKLTARW